MYMYMYLKLNFQSENLNVIQKQESLLPVILHAKLPRKLLMYSLPHLLVLHDF